MMQTAAKYLFRLYVTGESPNCVLAMQNLTELCRKYLPESHRIEVVDLLLEPQRAVADGVFMTPTLIKLAPAPESRLVGSLADVEPILDLIGLKPA